MLVPKIMELSTDAQTGELYCLVKFWKSKAARGRQDDPPFLTNDHVMVLRPTGTRLIDPDDPQRGTETFTRDLEAEIIENVRAYAERAERHGYQGDHSSANATAGEAFFQGGKEVRRKGARVMEPRGRNNSDPHGVLAKPEVAALRGKDIDLPAVARGQPRRP